MRPVHLLEGEAEAGRDGGCGGGGGGAEEEDIFPDRFVFSFSLSLSLLLLFVLGTLRQLRAVEAVGW